MVEESVIKQKSRIQWLKLGDSNTAYYHACMKNKQARNSINKLVTRIGQILKSSAEVEEEILSFYRGLLGTAATQLPTVNPEIMQKGHILTRRQQLQLIRLVTREEVKHSIMDIDDNKAPRCDGTMLSSSRKHGTSWGRKRLQQLKSSLAVQICAKPLTAQ